MFALPKMNLHESKQARDTHREPMLTEQTRSNKDLILTF